MKVKITLSIGRRVYCNPNVEIEIPGPTQRHARLYNSDLSEPIRLYSPTPRQKQYSDGRIIHTIHGIP